MKFALLALLLLVPQISLAQFRVWCESMDGSRHWSPSQASGVKDCGDGIRHISNVPLNCIDGGSFDYLNCRMPTGNNRDVVQRAGQDTANERQAVADIPTPRPQNDLSGAVLNIIEHTRAREELIDELSLD